MTDAQLSIVYVRIVSTLKNHRALKLRIIPTRCDQAAL